jgi:hypothetical protein
MKEWQNSHGGPLMPDAEERAVLYMLSNLKDAVAAGGMEEAQGFREKPLAAALNQFGADQNKALQRVYDLIGRWRRGVDGTTRNDVLGAINRAIRLFEN